MGGLELWVVKRRLFSDYALMYHIGFLRGQDLFYHKKKEDSSEGAFYKQVDLEEAVPIVDYYTGDYNFKEVKGIFDALKKEKFIKLKVPLGGFYVFKFKFRSPSSSNEGVEMLVCEAGLLEDAINKLKKVIKPKWGYSFQDFWVFFTERWRKLRCKSNKYWIPQEEVLEDPFEELVG